MIVSHKHKFIYLKLYKVAGTSVEYFLEQFCGNEDIVTPITPRESDTHKPRNYIEHYNSQTRKMVEVAYLRDIEYFGYEFGE